MFIFEDSEYLPFESTLLNSIQFATLLRKYTYLVEKKRDEKKLSVYNDEIYFILFYFIYIQCI